MDTLLGNLMKVEEHQTMVINLKRIKKFGHGLIFYLKY